MKIDFKTFRKEYKESLSQLEKKYGIKIELGNITYNNTEFRFKVICVSTSSIPQPTKLQGDNNINHIGKKLLINGKTYEVIDFKSRNFKNPFIIKDQKGKIYKISRETLNANLI